MSKPSDPRLAPLTCGAAWYELRRGSVLLYGSRWWHGCMARPLHQPHLPPRLLPPPESSQSLRKVQPKLKVRQWRPRKSLCRRTTHKSTCGYVFCQSHLASPFVSCISFPVLFLFSRFALLCFLSLLSHTYIHTHGCHCPSFPFLHYFLFCAPSDSRSVRMTTPFLTATASSSSAPAAHVAFRPRARKSQRRHP